MRMLLVTSSFFAAASLSAQTLENVTYSAETMPGSDYSSYMMNNVTFENSDIHDSNFSNATLNNFTIFVTEDSGLSNLETERYFANLNFSNSVWTGGKFSGLTTTIISNVTKETFVPVVLKNVNFSGATLRGVEFSSIDSIEGSTNFSGANLSGSNFYHVNVRNADSGLFEDAIINGVFFNQVGGLNGDILSKTGSYKKGDLSGLLINGYASSPTDLSGMDFSGMNLQGFGASSVNLSNANFTGSDLRGSGFSSFSTDTSGAIYKNTIMSNGVINNIAFNSESDVLVVRAHETNAKIAENAELSAGAIELLEGAKLEIADGVVVEMSDQIKIVFDADSLGGVEDLLVLGDGAGVVMAGYESDEAARAAFVNLFEDSEGNSVDWAPESVANFVSAAVPEPAAWAAIFGAFALALAAYRKRA